MTKSVQLPDGSWFPLKEGEDPTDALAAARKLYPEAFGAKPEQEVKPQSGGIAALKSGYSGLKSDVAALLGRTGAIAPEEAEKYIEQQKKYQAKTFKPTEEGWTEAPVTKFAELLGGSAPYMAAPFAVGAAAVYSPVLLGGAALTGTAATVAGAAAAGATSFGQFTGSFLSRQMDTGKKLGETDLGAATLAAIPAAALDTISLKMIPGIRGLLGSVGKEVTEAEARAIAQQSLGRTFGDYVAKAGKTAGVEGLTESAQQVLERLQAGLSITDDEARKEYVDSFLGGAVLGGTLSVPGRFVERGKLKTQAEQAEQRDKDAAKRAAAQAAEAARAAEEARKQTPEYMRQVVAESAALEKQKADLLAQIHKAPKGERLTEEQKQENIIVNAQLKELAPKLEAAAKESVRVKPLLAKFDEEARVAALSPEEFMLEQTFRGPGIQLPKGGRFETRAPEEPAAPPVPSAVEQYVAQQTEAAKQAGALTLQDRIDYLLADPIMADQIVKTRTPMPDLSKQDNKALLGALELQLKDQAKKELAARDAELRGQLPSKPPVGVRKTPDYNAYLEALDELDFARREGDTEAEVRALEKLRRQTEVTDQGELFGETASKTVLGQAPKTRRELLADLRIARAAGDNKAGMAVIDALRRLDDAEASRGKFQTGAAPEFRLTGEQRQRLFESGMTEEQIDEAESRAQKALGQGVGTGQTPMSVALQQMASESRADAFAEIVDLINRYNKGAAKREQLDAARERLISGLITDIQQTRGRELTDSEKQDITRNANVLLRELIERFGDTRSLSQKGKDVFVPAQTSTGEFRTEEGTGAGYPTVESQAPGRQTFGSPFAAAQSIREGLEELRTQAIAGDVTQFTRTFTPKTVSTDAVETQLARELAKDPKTHSTEQRGLLEAIADNLRMMLRPQTRQDVSDWLYDLARDPKNVAPERTQAVRDALQAVEQAKRSETEIETREFAQGKGERVVRAEQPELPLGPGRELRRTELEGPQKPAPAGTFSQISNAPAYEEVQPAVFGSYAELEKYLASDALQQVRSAMGLGMPTLARLQARVAPFMARINAARAQATELGKRAKAIEAQKRAELEALKAMSAKDLAAESQALQQARRELDDAKRRLAELEAPLKKELEPLIKEFANAQQQFEAAVAAQEQTMATMLYNRQVFENRELAAIENLHRVQRRMQAARSKIYKAFQEDFGNDPLNLARMMQEFKSSGKQGEFNEQLAKAHEELNKVFFDTRKDDAAILRFLKESAKLDSQLAAQNNAIDTLGEKLLNAGLALKVVQDSQVDIAENRDEILDARAQTQDAQRAVAAIEAKQRERLEQVNKLEDDLGLTRTEIPHRISEDTTVAEVLRASTDSEKALVQQLDAALTVANEQSAPVRALQSFKRNRERARAAKPETAQQTKARDEQQQRLIEAIGRDPASFEGERISAQQRRDLLEELGATEETKAGLEAVIAAADEAIPATQEKIAKAKKELKKLDKEIAALEAKAGKRPRSFIAKLELKSELAGLPALREARDRLAKGAERLTEDIATYEREKATAQANLETLAAREAELTALFSNDPEIRNAAVAALDKRIAKVETNIKNNKAGLQEKGISKTTRESRERELRKYLKELRELMAKRSAQFGIKRTQLSETGRKAAQPVEEGERLGARKVGAVVRAKRTAGNIRTGNLEAVEKRKGSFAKPSDATSLPEERKLSTRSKVQEGGKAKETAPIKPVEEAESVEDRIMGEMDALEKVRMTVEDRIVDAVADGNTEEVTRLKDVRTKIDSQMADKQAELKAAQKPAKRTKGKPELSRGVPAQGGQTVTELEQSLDRALGEKGLAARRIKLYESVEAFFAGPNKDKYDYDSTDIPTDAKAFVNPKNGDVFMFANNIAKNESVGVLLHEVGVHIGFRKLFGAARYNALVQTVKNWGARKDGSLEAKIAQRALARVEAAETSAEQFDDELLAYAVEEAVKAGVEPSALKKGSPLQNWLQIVLDTLRKALSAFGIDAKKLTSGDLVNMAYGAAQMEVRGTWHGSDAKFTAFDSKKAGQGEGAFDRRFDFESSIGEGPYTTPQQDYAEYYQRAVPFGKAANNTGYGNLSYQDYRALDERFMEADNKDLSPTELRQKFESRLLTAYLQGVNAGESLDPKASKAAQRLLNRLTTAARTPAEKAAVATLDLAKIKGLTQRPPEGQLYAVLDDMPRSQIFEINTMHKVGDRPKVDALLRKYGDPFDVSEAEQDGKYAGNSLFYGMRQKLGTKETIRLFQDAGIRAFERFVERGKNIERAYIEQAPDIIPLPEKPIGPAKGLLFSRKPQYESENALTNLADRVIAQPKSFKERMGSNLALEAEMNAVDMRAGLQEALKRGAKELGDDKLFTQAMYNVRKADQYMPLVYTTLTNGPLEFYTDDKGLRGLKSSNQNNAQEIFAAVKNVPGKNTEAKFALASTYMIAQRAANKGLSKLDLGELGLTEADLASAMAAVNADPALKSALEEVRRRYNAYNEGQIKLLADAGKISKAEAKAWLKDGDYVPYYRVRADGTAELVFGGEKTLTIGDIRTQPYLAELKGGEAKILPLNESLIRNTMLITKAALYNNATKEVAYAMQEFGAGKGPDGKNVMPIHKGQGPAGNDIIRFSQEPDPKDPKDDGKRWLRIVTKDTAMEGIPAELVVKSLEGAHLTLPAFLKIGGIAGDWLRKGVTRMPPYIFRQLIRDPMAASFTGGLNYGPFRAVVMAGTEFLRSSAGRSEAAKKLIEKGLIQSGVFTGDPDDMSTFATQLASGKDGPAIDRLFGMLDRAAMRADAATRKLVYENALKNGLSEVEADMMTMESMNFYKRGLSPTVQYANRLIPFMNAQIQGLNVLVKAMRGNMPFEERQRIQRKFWNNAVMLFGVGLVYAMAMEDDETFKNAKPRDKYTNFFVHLPGVSEAVKIPLPYEAGWFFTAAVALADAMKAEVKGEQQLTALRDIFLSSVPGYSSKFIPQAVKPLFEVYTNKNLFSGQNIESEAMQRRSPEERFSASTTEAAKALGKVLPFSPVQIEHLARAYFGTAPLAMMSVAAGFMQGEGKGEAPERRLSETPILGTVFQKKYGGADADTMYAFAKEATQRAASLNELKKSGDVAAAKEYLASHRTEIAMAPMARQFETLMGRIRTQETLIRNRKDLSAEEKRVRLDQLDKAKQDIADKFNAAVRRVEEQKAS